MTSAVKKGTPVINISSIVHPSVHKRYVFFLYRNCVLYSYADDNIMPYTSLSTSCILVSSKWSCYDAVNGVNGLR